ncbi:MAG: prepilin-type N-terminal cleavage/methylation domain-containing protein [Phycisphaerae bacterium]|nr:prepilin-type N-terminal cleavage/methylation domain-containing protein [Phycisphaerae bacterium]
MNQRRMRRMSQGFTLIELLVVISIIALLISILLPQLSAAKRLAQAVVCAANLKAANDAKEAYANDNEDWVVGAPSGSGGHLSGSFAYGAPVQKWDFMGPALKVFGVPLPEDGGNPATIARFNLIRNFKGFQCPSNQYLATWFAGPNAGTGPMIAFNTSRYMLLKYKDPPDALGVDDYDNSHEEKLPENWSPRITRMGDASRKIFCADGARYSTVSILPDYDLTARAAWGGAFADVAPYSTWTRSWDRSGMNVAGPDARLYAFRHSTGVPKPQARANALLADCLFFDGHVEKLGDLAAANPFYWLPAGSRLETTSMYPDVLEHYGLTGGEIQINN